MKENPEDKEKLIEFFRMTKEEVESRDRRRNRQEDHVSS